MGVWSALRWWVVTRFLAVAFFVLVEGKARKDVWYFAHSLDHLHRRGLGHTLVEYPVPAVAVIALPWLVAKALGMVHAYVRLFALVALATDLAFTVLVARRAVDRTAVLTWLAAVPLLGAMSYFRFDLLPAVLVGAAILLLAARPRLAMLCVSVATAVKLWPALVVPPLLAGVRRRWRNLAVVVVSGTVLAALSVAAAGWARLVSPLLFERHRGLQIESVWATPAMVAWALRAAPLRITTRFHARELVGSWVPPLLAASTVWLVLVVLGLLLLWWRMLRDRHRLASAEQVVWVSLAAICGFMVAGKVLSPQYLIWVLAAVVGGLAVVGGSSRRLVRWTVLLLVATALTQLVFPISYSGFHRHDWRTPYAELLLAIRNVLLLWLLVTAWVNAWRSLGDGRSRSLPVRLRRRGSAQTEGPAMPVAS